MYDHTKTSVNSAKAFSELSAKRAEEAKRQEAATNLSKKLAKDQVELHKEANDLARRALVEAQESKVGSNRSLRISFISLIVTVITLIVVVVDLLFI